MPDGMLRPYRVLDLTDEHGLLCGRLLADLGADVIKVEPPGGDAARGIGPFYGDDPDPEKSLYWFAFNANKRGVTIDLESPAGHDQFAALVSTADIVIESFAPGRMDALGFGYDAIRRINPACILVSISPFGQTGPYRDYKASDIVLWALGGLMSVCGPEGGPPYHVSHHSISNALGAADAAVGAMIALFQRARTRLGQHVDVAVRETIVRSTFQVTASWDMTGANIVLGRGPEPVHFPWSWRCKDGRVVTVLWAGSSGERRTRPLFDWMLEAGVQDDAVSAINWETLVATGIEPELHQRVCTVIERFFRTRTKGELYEQGRERGLSIMPIQNAADIANNAQLRARDFWQPLDHEALETALTYPGPWAKGSEAPPTLRRRAPRIGEHSDEILTAASSASRHDSPAALEEQASDLKPLAGVKVLDFSWFVVGPVTTKPFSDYGADVIRIESSVQPDLIRLAGPHKDGVFGIDRGGDNAQLRTGQRSIALNLSTDGGKALARRLVAWADVVVDNFAAGAIDRMGFGYEALRAISPEIIMLSCCGQGQDGPHASVKGGGSHFVALSGLRYLAGPPDGVESEVHVLTDYAAPRFNTLLLLAALDHRRRTGRGSHFDVSQVETTLTLAAPIMLDYFANGRIAMRMGNRHSDAAPHGAYPCGADRWCTIAVFGDEDWRAFVPGIGAPPWTQDPRFATHAERKRHEDELDQNVAAWTRSRRPDEVMRLLQAVGVAAGEVARGEELLDGDPQLEHRGFWQTLEHPEIGSYRAPAHAFRLSGAPLQMTPAPMLGEHTAEVLRQVLDLSDDEIAGFAAGGVLE